MKCNCNEDIKTGWTEIKCCNICGYPEKTEPWEIQIPTKEWEKQLRLILKNRLSNRVNPRYLEWIATNKNPNYHGSHEVKKRNDLMIAKRDPESHLYREYEDYTENHLQCLENIFDYVEYLQNKLVENNIKF